VRLDDETGKTDLRRLAALALGYFDDLFERKPNTGGRFRDRLLLLALCQGAALHYVDGSHGVKDFDVWASSGACQTCLFRLAATDGATSGARASAADYANRYEGRRVGILGRSIDVRRCGGAALAGLRGSSPWYLAQRPIIAIYPDLILGRRIWSPAK
jgi:hypothetical protein